MIPGRTYTAIIEFNVPQTVSEAEVRAFITGWLESGGGNRPPHDPLFSSLQRVHIGRMTEKKHDQG